MKHRWNSKCMGCLADKYMRDYPEDTPEEIKAEYMQRLFQILADAKPREGAPVITERINRLHEELIGPVFDYTETKHVFNELMLGIEENIYPMISSSDDQLLAAIQYVMAGNYIDFGALENVTEQKLMTLLSEASNQVIRTETLEKLKSDLSEAKSLAFLTDNCGEIVLDKLLIKTIKTLYPNINITVIVRGKHALNDATLEDAIEVGLPQITTVIGNGVGIPGTDLEQITKEASDIIHNADVLISKGMGNFETLCGCGLNLYYIFLCKCELFTTRFNANLFDGMLVRELDGK